MRSMITVPARVVPRVREGLYTRVRDVSDLIDAAARQANREEDPALFEAARSRLDAIWRLLDTIGWRTADDNKDVEVDAVHTTLLLDVAELMLPLMAGWLRETPASEQAGARVEYQQTQAFAAALNDIPTGELVIPLDIEGLLRLALYAAIARAGGALDERFSLKEPGDPHQLRALAASCLARLHGTVALLDQIGWGLEAVGGVVIDRCVHGRALAEIADAELEHWGELAEATATLTPEGRAQAAATGRRIREFFKRRV
jgi:hypothetical protein